MARWDDERRRGRPGEGGRDERREERERDAEGQWGEGEWPPPRLAHGGALRDEWRERVERYGGDPGWREYELRDDRGRWQGDAGETAEGWRGDPRGAGAPERDEGFWRGGRGGPSSWRGGESGLRGEQRWRAEEPWRGEERIRQGSSHGMPPRREPGGLRDRGDEPSRARDEERWRAGAPRAGEGGWRRTSQFSPTGEGPGSWGRPGDDPRDRWADADRFDEEWRRRALETSDSGFRGTGGQARGYEERAWAREERMGRGPKGYRRPDDRILEEVCERIARSNVNADEVEVAVENGEVMLSGVAESRWDKRSIEDLAQEVYGVEQVQNQIRVKSATERARDANRPLDQPGEPVHH